MIEVAYEASRLLGGLVAIQDERKVFSIRVDTSSDLRWILVTVEESEAAQPAVAVEREALNVAAQGESRPPDQVLGLIARRALRRIPTANGRDGLRLITVHNLSVVWPK